MNFSKEFTSAILIIGNEILSGRTVDKNTSFIAKWLGDLGISVEEVKIIPDKDCPGSTAYMLQMNTLSLMSIGSCVQLTELDGNRVLRQSADDGVEVRVHSYSQLACTAPGKNCVVTLP